MYKIILCYTAHNAGSDWLESEYNITEHNYRSCIDDYIARFGYEANRLNQKWKHDSMYSDSLFLNYYDKHMPISLRSKIEDYMDELSSEFGKFGNMEKKFAKRLTPNRKIRIFQYIKNKGYGKTNKT